MISTTQLQFRDWTTFKSFMNLLNLFGLFILFWNRNISNDFEMRAEPLFCVMGQPSRSYYLPARATQGIVKQETVFPQISWNICDFFILNSTRTWAKYYLPATQGISNLSPCISSDGMEYLYYFMWILLYFEDFLTLQVGRYKKQRAKLELEVESLNQSGKSRI